MLARIKLRLFLVAPHSVAHLYLAELQDGRESRHLVFPRILILVSGLRLELTLGDLSEQRNFVRAAGYEVAVLEQVLVVALVSHSPRRLLEQCPLRLVEQGLLLLSERVDVLLQIAQLLYLFDLLLHRVDHLVQVLEVRADFGLLLRDKTKLTWKRQRHLPGRIQVGPVHTPASN